MRERVQEIEEKAWKKDKKAMKGREGIRERRGDKLKNGGRARKAEKKR